MKFVNVDFSPIAELVGSKKVFAEYLRSFAEEFKNFDKQPRIISRYSCNAFGQYLIRNPIGVDDEYSKIVEMYSTLVENAIKQECSRICHERKYDAIATMIIEQIIEKHGVETVLLLDTENHIQEQVSQWAAKYNSDNLLYLKNNVFAYQASSDVFPNARKHTFDALVANFPTSGIRFDDLYGNNMYFFYRYQWLTYLADRMDNPNEE